MPGARHVNGWHVQRFIGGKPATPEDGETLRAALAAVHAATVAGRSAMDPEVADAVRSAWAVAAPVSTCVVHVDAGGGNALVTSDGRCALIDWDEARVDDPLFDLAGLPGSVPLHARAALAWEIAVCWHVEPDYARSLLSGLLGR